MTAQSVGIIGCGTVTQTFYAKTLREHADYKVEMVADLDSKQAAAAAAIFGARVETTEAIAQQADSVIIATPPSTHAALISQCLKAGRVIFCEKPFTTSLATAEQLVADARASQTPLYVGHFRRLFPQVQLARRLVDLGVLGDITAISASEGGRFTWETVSDYTTRDPAGGVLWDTGSHTVDMALFASGVEAWPDLDVQDVAVSRDQPEPSHELTGEAKLVGSQSVDLFLRVSRTGVLPNLVRITGTRASASFTVGLDDRVMLTTDSGSVPLSAGQVFEDALECFDLQLQKVLLQDGAELFAAERFLAQLKILESFANA